jgi:hypothetical protein
MLVVGVVVLVGLLATAVALWIGAGNRRADNVATFARAPVGCDTTLDFEATGTFLLYAETSGEFDQLAGECDAELRYDRDPEDVPELALTLLDPNGEPVVFEDADPVGYDVDGFVGTAARSVRIETPGDHVLTVAPTAGDPFAVAIGRSPDQGVALLRWGAVAAAIVGLVLGGVFLVLGSRRVPTPTSPDAPWTPDAGGWPASPPGFPVPAPTTGATAPAGPPLASPPSNFAPTSPPPPRPAGPPAPGDEQRSPWAPPPPASETELSSDA